MESVDVVIKNGMYLTMDDRDTIISGGGLAIDNGLILAIGKSRDILERYRGKKVVDAGGKAILPGFVNSHFHFTQNFMKGTRDDLNLLDWIDEVSFPRIKVIIDNYRDGDGELHDLSVMHAGIDLLSSGVTTTVNMEWGMLPEIYHAYEKVGMRVINVLTLTDIESWTPKEAIIEEEELFQLASDLITAFHREGSKVEFAYGIACPNSASDNLMVRARETASTQKVGLHIHLAETNYEYERYVKEKQSTPTRYLESLGIWDKDVWAAHCIWLDEGDIDILAQAGTGVAHNPKCNMKISSGAAPITDMRKKGIDVGIGIDSCAVSDNTDFFEAMRTMVFLQRVSTMDPKAVLGIDALRMATIEGARALGKDKEIGSLEVGKQADILLVNLADVNTRPYNDIVNNLVFAANSSNIDSVIVGGEFLMNNKTFTRFDKNTILNEVEKRAAEIYRAAGIEIPRHFCIQDIEERY